MIVHELNGAVAYTELINRVGDVDTPTLIGPAAPKFSVAAGTLRGAMYEYTLPAEATAFTVVGSPGTVRFASLRRFVESKEGAVGVFVDDVAPPQVLHDYWPIRTDVKRWLYLPTDHAFSKLRELPLPSPWFFTRVGDDILGTDDVTDIPITLKPFGPNSVVFSSRYFTPNWPHAVVRQPQRRPGTIIRLGKRQTASNDRPGWVVGSQFGYSGVPEGYVIGSQAVSAVVLSWLATERGHVDEMTVTDVYAFPPSYDIGAIQAGEGRFSTIIRTAAEVEVRYRV